jgi:hypothetical protein
MKPMAMIQEKIFYACSNLPYDLEINPCLMIRYLAGVIGMMQ